MIYIVIILFMFVWTTVTTTAFIMIVPKNNIPPSQISTTTFSKMNHNNVLSKTTSSSSSSSLLVSSRSRSSKILLLLSMSTKNTPMTEITESIDNNESQESSKVLSSSSTSSSSTVVEYNFDHPIILFDGICNFCNIWVDVLLRIDTKGKYKLTPLQSTIGKELLVSIGKNQNDISSIVLIETDGITYYTKSNCVLQVIRQLGISGQIMSNIIQSIIPLSIRDNIYDMVAENRYNLLGQRDICRSGDPIYYDRFV